jgi:hypothetical protein
VFVATQKNDDAERKRVAEIFSKQYGKEFRAEEINCDGCVSGGARVFSYCGVCEIRKCCKGKGVGNCASCGDYACVRLAGLFGKYDKAKETLDEIRREYGII